MVSFFGLKIGGDKKKKSSRDLQISAPQPRNPNDSNAIDENFFDFQGVPNPSYEASVYSLSRQVSGQSTSSIRGKFKGLKAPFASNKFGSSMTDLPTPPSLRHHASNPSLSRQWTTGSSTNLGFAPPSFHPMARPSTSDGRSKTWVNPLDVHFSRDSSKPGFKGPLTPGPAMQDDGSPSTPLSTPSKSPLGRYELKLDLPEDMSSFADFGDFKNIGEAPAPLRIRKPASNRLAERPQTSRPQKPPSPPQSIAGKDQLRNAVPEPPRRPATAGPHTGFRTRDKVPSGLEELQNAISNFGPTSLPSPSTTPRESEEKPSTTVPARPTSPPAKKGNPKPVIQNVHAKRDTLTINPQRRRSLEMKIEAAESGNVPSLSLADQPKTSSGIRADARPPPLTLNIGFRSDTADRDGPPTAPFLPNPMRSLAPTGAKSSPRQHISGQGESGHPASVNESSKHHSGADSPTGSSVYNEDDDVYHHPPSPESTSPVIPLTGPLASPRFPPASQSPRSSSAAFQFPRKDEMNGDRGLSPTTPPVPPRSLRRNQPTPDSSYWPVPSSAALPSDRAAKPPSPADSRLRSESESDSLYGHDPLGPPRIPATRSGAGSPTFRSFSRPWTPTTAGGPKTSSLKSSETTGLHPVLGAGGEFGGGLRPPPRSVTVKAARTEAGTFKSPAIRIGGNGLGGGFI